MNRAIRASSSELPNETLCLCLCVNSQVISCTINVAPFSVRSNVTSFLESGEMNGMPGRVGFVEMTVSVK